MSTSESECTELTKPERLPIEHVPTGVLDLRTNFLSMDAATMERNLAEYDSRRQALRKWIESKLIEGVHFGYPPGCEPVSRVVNGERQYMMKVKGSERWYPEKQWKPKPSLYKPTADMLCEAFGLKAVFEADMEAWQQTGSLPGYFVTRCRLISLTSGEEIAQGRGVRKIGDKGGDANNAIKMSQKSAKNDATINAFGISDLFTQDLEGLAPPLHDNPDADPNAPETQARGDRITRDDARALFSKWVDFRVRLVMPADPKEFEGWVEGVTGMDRTKIGSYTNWTRADHEKCLKSIDDEIASREPSKGETMFGEES